MSDERVENDEVFGARLGRLLRTHETAGDDFEQGLVAAIRADRPIERERPQRRNTAARSWWSSPLTIRLSPLAALPIAASIVALVGLALRAPRSEPRAVTPTQTVAERVVHDTVSVVRFVFVGDAKTVSLVGDFNAWGARPVELTRTGAERAWAVTVPLVNGRHEYAFIVDGKHWVADPFAPPSLDEFDTNSSIITVGT